MGTRIVYPKYFPFCVEEITDSTLVGDGTNRPLSFSLGEMLYLYWVTKFNKVNVSTEFSTSGTTNFLLIDYFTSVLYTGGDINCSEYGSYTITQESDFLCNLVGLTYFNHQENDGVEMNPDGENSVYMNSNFYMDININVGSVFLFDNLYYPIISVSIDNGTIITDTGDFVGGNVVVFSNNRGEEPPSPPDSGWTEVDHKINIFGKSYFLHGWKNDAFDGDGTITTLLQSNASETTIEPAAGYWEYATKGGLPVYDSITGAQLNNPFS